MSIEVFNLVADDDGECDLLIFAVGYEARARFIASERHQKSTLILGYVFSEGHIFSFDKNMKFLKDVGGHILESGSSIENCLAQIGEVESYSGRKICIDVSSLNRGAMAAIFAELLDSNFFAGAEIEVIYSVAKFSRPPKDEMDFLDFGPLEEFGGWTSSPENPTVLLLGLGYETDHAIGALEYLDPSATFAFFPIGSDERFETEVGKANEAFFELLSPDRIIQYSVISPYQTYWQMRSLVLSLREVSRTVLVPMGPKIFCSLCLVCQRVFGNEVSVWRASGHSLDSAQDAEATGETSGYLIRRDVA